MPAGCQAPRPADDRPVQRSQPLLGTFVTITAYGPDRENIHDAISSAFEEIRRVDGVLSIHRSDSEASALNARAAESPTRVSPELYGVIQKAAEISEQTDGAFDISIGPLARLWGFIWKEYRLPTAAELDPVLPLVNFRNVHLGEQETVSFARRGMFLDFGGIGKGYAVDRAIEVLKKRGVENAMVRAGGDLRVIGLPPGKDAWEVQLEDPAKRGNRIRVPLKSGALSTSGNYENYFEIAGQRYSHILDPKTGLPARGIVSCTVRAPTCMESDAFATAFFVLGIEQTMRRFAGAFAIRFVDSEMRVIESK